MTHAMQGHQGIQIIEKSSDQTWSTGEGNGKPLQYSCLEIHTNRMKRQKEMTPEVEPPPPDQ